MPDGDYRVQPITFERGINESVEPSLLPAGAAVRIRNWVSDPSGNLRSRFPWKKASTTGAPATRRGRGIASYTQATKPVVIQSNVASVVSTSGTTVTATPAWPANTKAGSFLIMRVMAGHASDTTAVTMGTVPSGWSTAVTASKSSTSPGQFVGIYFIQNAAAAVSNPSVTITGASGVAKRLVVEISEWANMSTTFSYPSSNDTAVTSNNNGNSAAVTWAEPSALEDVSPQSRLDIAAAFVSVAGRFTPGTSNNDYEKTYEGKDSNTTAGTFHRVTSDTQLAFNQNISTSGYWLTAAVSFRGAESAAEVPYIVAAAAKTSSPTAYEFYSIDRNNLASGTWSKFDTVEIADTSFPVASARGLGYMFYCAPNFSNIRRWNSLGAPTVINTAPAGRALAFHNNRLWSGGSTFAPSRLFYSEINNASDWTGTAGTNYIDISTDDGEPIEDIISFGSYLLIGKRSSLWLLSGSSEQDFALSKLSAGGCAPGRAMVSTPYGAVVAGKTAVWLVGDGTVESASRAIIKSYSPGGYMSASFANDVASICDESTGIIWSLNMNTGVWSEERVDSDTERPFMIRQSNDIQLFCPVAGTMGSLVSYRSFPSSERGKDFDTLSETYEAITPELWPVGNTVKITPRHLFVRVRQRGGTADQTGLTITPYYEGWEGTSQTFGPEDSAGIYRYRFDLGERRGVNYAQFKFSQTVPSGQASIVDIEEVEFGFNVEQVR